MAKTTTKKKTTTTTANSGPSPMGLPQQGAANPLSASGAITIPTGDIKAMMSPPYMLTLQEAMAAKAAMPHGYYLHYNYTNSLGMTEIRYPTSGSTFQQAMLLLQKDVGKALYNNLNAFMNVPTSATKASTAYTRNWKPLSQWGSFANVPVSDWYNATASGTGKFTKSVAWMKPNEFSAYIDAKNNAAQIQAAYIYKQGAVQAAHIAATGQAEAALIGATASQQANVFDNVTNILDSWGMASTNMQNEVHALIFNDHLSNQNAVLDVIRGSKEYANAFQGLAERNAKLGPGGEHMTEQQHQQYVATVQNMLGQYGIPASMVSKKEIGTLVENNVAPTEFEARITKGYLAYQNADASTKALLQKEYNIGPNLGAAYFLNPKNAEPNFEKAIAQATLQNYAVHVGLKDFGQQDAAALFAKMKLSGVTNSQGALANPYSQYTMAQAQADLLAASKNVPLTQSLPGEGNPTVTTRDLLGAQIAGFGTAPQRDEQMQVERAAQAKVAPFERGGGPEATSTGVVGVGGAKT